jgi:hypothetical protein
MAVIAGSIFPVASSDPKSRGSLNHFANRRRALSLFFSIFETNNDKKK